MKNGYFYGRIAGKVRFRTLQLVNVTVQSFWVHNPALNSLSQDCLSPEKMIWSIIAIIRKITIFTLQIFRALAGQPSRIGNLHRKNHNPF